MSYFLSTLILNYFLYLFEDIEYLTTLNSFEDIVGTSEFYNVLTFAIILIVIFVSSVFSFFMYRIMRPIAVFIMAKHAGYCRPWIAFVPYGTHYLEYVLPIREFNIFNWIKTDHRTTIAWVYIGFDLGNPLISLIFSFIPLIGGLAKYAYKAFWLVYKWRKYYDLLKTFGFKKAVGFWAAASVLCKPLYTILLFIMCDRTPDYGFGRYDYPILLTNNTEYES